jgi:hypothetical protein
MDDRRPRPVARVKEELSGGSGRLCTTSSTRANGSSFDQPLRSPKGERSSKLDRWRTGAAVRQEPGDCHRGP